MTVIEFKRGDTSDPLVPWLDFLANSSSSILHCVLTMYTKVYDVDVDLIVSFTNDLRSHISQIKDKEIENNPEDLLEFKTAFIDIMLNIVLPRQVVQID